MADIVQRVSDLENDVKVLRNDLGQRAKEIYASMDTALENLDKQVSKTLAVLIKATNDTDYRLDAVDKTLKDFEKRLVALEKKKK